MNPHWNNPIDVYMGENMERAMKMESTKINHFVESKKRLIFMSGYSDLAELLIRKR